jgi:hypothetical protein
MPTGLINTCLLFDSQNTECVIIIPDKLLALKLSLGNNDLIPNQFHQVVILSGTAVKSLFNIDHLLNKDKKLLLHTNMMCSFDLKTQTILVRNNDTDFSSVLHKLLIIDDKQQYEIHLINQIDLTDVFKKVLG